MNKHEKLNYVEFHAKDIPETKRFFEAVFSWTFVDYGPDYTAFSNQGLDGGFFNSDKLETASSGAPLLVFYSSDILATLSRVQQYGGVITQDIFTFPGGCRFHFTESSGNEFAVWSESEDKQEDA